MSRLYITYVSIISIIHCSWFINWSHNCHVVLFLDYIKVMTQLSISRTLESTWLPEPLCCFFVFFFDFNTSYRIFQKFFFSLFLEIQAATLKFFLSFYLIFTLLRFLPRKQFTLMLVTIIIFIYPKELLKKIDI